jgi:hypothetical protein
MPNKSERAKRYTLKRYKSLDQMKADECAYWQSQPNWVRMQAVADLSSAYYKFKKQPVRVQKLQRPALNIERE